MNDTNLNKTLVIGLDGASWRVLDPLINNGLLPNFKRLKTEGAWSILESIIPPVTCPAWKCYSTGKNPGKLGVFWWVNFDKNKKQLIVPNQHSFKSKDLWDYFGEQNKKVAVINMPTTYPPKRVNGIMISGFGAPLDKEFNFDQKYTYPPELQEQIENQYNYQVGIKELKKENKEYNKKIILQFFDNRFKLLLDTLQENKYQFIHFTIFYINVLQHFYGSDKIVHEAWKKIDNYIGEIMHRFPDINLFFMSDHGNVDIETGFVINNWLYKNGYLKFKKNFDYYLGKLISYIDIIPKKLINKKLITGISRRVLPKRLIENHPMALWTVPTSSIDSIIDWDKSTVVALSQGPIYINYKNVGKDKNKFLEHLINHLKEIKDPFTGERAIIKVYKKDEIYNGPYTDNAPDLVIVPKNGIEIYGGFEDKIFHKQKNAWTSGNHPHGIFMAWGTQINNKGQLSNKNILDITPTILALNNIPIPDDLDGQVMKEIFLQDIIIRSQKSKLTTSKESISTTEQAIVKKRLEELGYLG